MRKKVGLLVLFMFFSFMLFGATTGMSFGEPEYDDMDGYILENAQEETASNNVVTSVLLEYRSLDTLGEATVLIPAILSVVVVLRRFAQ